MKKFTLFLLIVLIGAASVSAQTSKAKTGRIVKKPAAKASNRQIKNQIEAPPREKFDPTRNADDDLQSAIARAQKENKRIILDVGGEWCGWCREMDNFFMRNAELNKLREENYVWLKINFSEENKNAAFLANYPQIKGYPHLYVLEKDGKFLYSKDTSELEDGVKSYNLQKFTEFLSQYAPEKSVAN